MFLSSWEFQSSQEMSDVSLQSSPEEELTGQCERAAFLERLAPNIRTGFVD